MRVPAAVCVLLPPVCVRTNVMLQRRYAHLLNVTGELRVWRVVAAFTLTGLATGGAALLQAKRQEHAQSDAHTAKRTAAVASGLQAGVCFGLSAASCKVGTHVCTWIPQHRAAMRRHCCWQWSTVSKHAR